MAKSAVPLPRSNSDAGFWGSPISLIIGILLGGLGGGSVYWVAERSHAKDASEAAQVPIITVATTEETEPEPPPSAAEKPAAPVVAAADEEKEADEESEAETEEDTKTATAEAAAKTDEAEEVEEEAEEAESKTGSAHHAEDGSEKAMLKSAKSKLRTGDTFGAQVILEDMRKRFPKGSLAQPRELLYIKTQKALGATEAAKKSARAFATQYPNSPYLSSLEGLLLDP